MNLLQQPNPENYVSPVIPGDDFVEKFDEIAREANETPQPPAIDIPDPTSGAQSVKPPEPEPAIKPGETFFAKEDLKPEVDDYVPTVKKWSKAELDDSMEIFLNVRNIMQAEILSWLAAEDDTAVYEMDEAELNKLARVWAPVLKKYGGKIPDWLLIILAEATVLTPLVKRAYTDGKTNRANREMQADETFTQTVQQALASKKRQYYYIDSNGYYIGAKTGKKYLKEKDRTEKANIADIEFIIRDNELSLVKKAFPNLDLTKYEPAA